MHDKNIELLRDETQRLLLVEVDLLQRMLNEEGIITQARAGEQQTFDSNSIPKHLEILRGEQAKLDELEMVLAIVGPMKAGKSTTINAIVGTEILPNRNRAMTALPTLIRHTPGQTQPILKFNNSQPINNLMENLHQMIKGVPRKDILERLESKQDMEELLALISENTRFEQRYEGAERIFWFLRSLNDLVRLSSELGLEFPFSCYDEVHEIPVIEVEFAHLAAMEQTHGRLTLLDTPGPNESGQQHLRKMLNEQLSKASAVLAILDYTQLKTEADAEVREELKKIASLVQGRLYIIVNRFDDKDRNGDDQEQVKAFVADSLMQGLIEKNNVFPASARWAYLANKAKHELFLHKQLPDPAKQEWVKDFAQEGFGRRWENKISHLDEVRQAADDLWTDSLFSYPLEHVIQSAHSRAAALAIDSAAAKLIDMAEKVENFLGLRQSALTKSSHELQQQIESLILDIGKIEKHESETRVRVDETLELITKNTETIFTNIKNKSRSGLDRYFNEGKRSEKAQVDAKKKTKKTKVIDRIIFPLFGTRGSSDPNIDFDPESPLINFDNADDANKLMQRIRHTVEETMKSAEDDAQDNMSLLLQEFNDNFTQDVMLNAQKIIADMQDRMTSNGLSISIKLPEVNSLKMGFSADEMLNELVEEKSKTVTHRRRTSRVWGTVCKWFDTNDWGWEDYSSTEQYFEIDMLQVKSLVMSGIEHTLEGFGQSVSTYIAAPLKTSTNNFFNNFRTVVEQIRGDLLQSIRDQKRGKSQQEALIKRLSSVKKNVPATLLDCRELKADTQPLLTLKI